MLSSIRFKTVLTNFSVACMVLGAIGCGSDEPVAPDVPSGPRSPDDAMAAWRTLMDAPAENLENPNLKALAAEVGRTSPQHVDEMVAILGEADLSNEKLMATVSSLEEAVSPDTVPALLEFTQPERPAHIRAAATHLIGLIQSPEANTALESLRNDEAGTVKLAALLRLVDRGDESAREELRELYGREDISLVTRERIVMSLAPAPMDSDLPLLEKAVQTDGFAQQTYLIAASALGRVGTRDSIAALGALKSNPNSSVGVSEMCDGSIAAIEERLDGTPAGSS